MRDDINRIQPGGATEIFGALVKAFGSLRQAKTQRRHVLLLTDGQAPGGGLRDMVRMGEGSLGIIGLGSSVDESLLRMLAEEGGGRFYKVVALSEVRGVLTREIELILRSD
jgi:Mg-chelatase subunit ChlD